MTPVELFLDSPVLMTAAAFAYAAVIWWMLGIYGGRDD